MADEKRRSKRVSHSPAMDEGLWECSMCTYKNPPEAFKCEMCECRKGTSTRKPRLNPQLIAQQAAQQVFTPPPPTKKEKKERKSEKRDKEKDLPDSTDVSFEDEQEAETSSVRDDMIEPTATPSLPPPPPPLPVHVKKEPSTSKEKPETHSTKCYKKKPARLKNIDRSSGQSMEVTVGDVTVTITDYKPMKKERSTAASAAGADKSHKSPDSKDSTNQSPDKNGLKDAVNGEVKKHS